jgi:hypothetical protein
MLLRVAGQKFTILPIRISGSNISAVLMWALQHSALAGSPWLMVAILLISRRASKNLCTWRTWGQPYTPSWRPLLHFDFNFRFRSENGGAPFWRLCSISLKLGPQWVHLHLHPAAMPLNKVFFPKWLGVSSSYVNFSQQLQSEDVYYCCPPVKNIGHMLNKSRLMSTTQRFWPCLAGRDTSSEVCWEGRLVTCQWLRKTWSLKTGSSLFSRRKGTWIWFAIFQSVRLLS